MKEPMELIHLCQLDSEAPPDLELRAAASTFYLACIRAGMPDEGAEFAEWYLDTFDHDLET